ncbi:MAG: rod shape-determining protein MreC [Thermodesulfobacteriota bacterium]|nr:rod shape-determining protein MreC [Thermodesulfobacteriota bacterium]
MFSRKTLLLITCIIFIVVNLILLTASSRGALPKSAVERVAISLAAPFQMIFFTSVDFIENIWETYFSTVSAVQENAVLKEKLARAANLKNKLVELELENRRLRKFIDFKAPEKEILVAAKVIGRDPSPWFRTIMIGKGQRHGLVKGLPVLVSEGVVGQIVSVSEKYARVLLITDRSSAVDALVQDTRSRGIVKGDNTDHCCFMYVLRKDEVEKGDIIVSSGLDQVFPKGLRIGMVVEKKKGNSRLFQTIIVKTSVDFDKLEEVLVSLGRKNSPEDLPSEVDNEK